MTICGMTISARAALIAGAVIGMTFVQAVMHGSAAEPQAAAGNLYDEVLLLNWRPKRDGFGSVLVASFDLKSYADRDVKDIELACRFFAESGTEIGNKKVTVYRRIKPRQTIKVKDFNAGFMPPQSREVGCNVAKYAQE